MKKKPNNTLGTAYSGSGSTCPGIEIMLTKVSEGCFKFAQPRQYSEMWWSSVTLAEQSVITWVNSGCGQWWTGRDQALASIRKIRQQVQRPPVKVRDAPDRDCTHQQVMRLLQGCGPCHTMFLVLGRPHILEVAVVLSLIPGQPCMLEQRDVCVVK